MVDAVEPRIRQLLQETGLSPGAMSKYRTGVEDYDPIKLGWKVHIVDDDGNLSPFERRKIYDTTRPGRGNGGHTFGDDLTPEERLAVIEYLKTL